MAEILPDGTMQGYYNICKDCGKTIEVNMQGTPINHKCEVKILDIPPVSNLVCEINADHEICSIWEKLGGDCKGCKHLKQTCC